MIEVKNLVKYYGRHRAVDDLSFVVDTGKVVGFLGPNGAGKSTTMNMITGYIAPTSGKVLIDGIDMGQKPEKAKENIGYLPEIPPLYQDLRVREYLMFAAELKKMSRKKRDAVVYDVMKKTGILDVSERLIRHLSKGYRQRMGLAGALVGNPDILILDEPTVGLDPGQIMEMRELIRELSKDHTVLLSSHIMQEISAVCDEIIIISGGRMIAAGAPEELIGQIRRKNGIKCVIKGEREKILPALEALEQVEEIEEAEEPGDEGFLSLILHGSEEKEIKEQVFFAMAEISCPIYEMTTPDASLEEAFLALTEGGSGQLNEDGRLQENGSEQLSEDGTLEEDGSEQLNEDGTLAENGSEQLEEEVR